MTPTEMFKAPRQTLKSRRRDLERQLSACHSQVQYERLSLELEQLNRAISMDFGGKTSQLIKYIGTGEM